MFEYNGGGIAGKSQKVGKILQKTKKKRKKQIIPYRKWQGKKESARHRRVKREKKRGGSVSKTQTFSQMGGGKGGGNWGSGGRP